jgi:hypothetical protein
MGMSVSRRRRETQDDKTVYVAGEGDEQWMGKQRVKRHKKVKIVYEGGRKARPPQDLFGLYL